MNSMETETVIMDGHVFIQLWPCSRTVLPDGAEAAIWRGVAYRLQEGNRIDISASVAQSAHGPTARIIADGDTSWVLVQGLASDLAHVQSMLVACGETVTRTGRWLGEAEGGVTFDWFIRCASLLGTEALRVLSPEGSSAAEANDRQRIMALEGRLSELSAMVARLESVQPVTAPALRSDHELALARDEIARLHAEIEAQAPTPSPLPPPPPAALRLRDEIGAAFAALRPDVDLLRDSLEVVCVEFHARPALWRAIGELPASGVRPEGWKSLRGVDRFWERHISTGRDDSGRAYARFDRQSRVWRLLIGWKVDQSRDIAWLANHVPQN
jgi:hypothetical protein